MDQSACKLTLVLPVTAEDRIVELLLESEVPITGFTTWAAEGHGHDFGDATASERVRGRVKRRVLAAVMSRERADALLEEIRQKAPIPHLAFWIEPVERFGRLSEVAVSTDGVEAPEEYFTKNQQKAQGEPV